MFSFYPGKASLKWRRNFIVIEIRTFNIVTQKNMWNTLSDGLHAIVLGLYILRII